MSPKGFIKGMLARLGDMAQAQAVLRPHELLRTLITLRDLSEAVSGRRMALGWRAARDGGSLNLARALSGSQRLPFHLCARVCLPTVHASRRPLAGPASISCAG